MMVVWNSVVIVDRLRRYVFRRYEKLMSFVKDWMWGVRKIGIKNDFKVIGLNSWKVEVVV